MSDPTTEARALAIVPQEDLSPTRYSGINRGQLELLKRTYAKGTTDDEFALYMNTAQRLKLDPFARQIYAVKRWDSNTKTEVMATQVAIDGYRAVAEDTGEYDGREGPFWCGDDEIWKEVWVSAKPPTAAKVVVYRKGGSRGYVGVARYQSYVQKNKDGGPRATWATMPDVMLAKCAEAQALRAAFPKQLAGTNTPDEMDQATDAEVVDMTRVAQALPAAATVATAQPKPQTTTDTWPAFLSDISQHVDDKLVEHVGKPLADWSDVEVERAMSWLLDACESPKDCTDKLGPWGQMLNKHARPGSRAATLFAGFNKTFVKRLADLRAKAAGAPS